MILVSIPAARVSLKKKFCLEFLHTILLSFERGNPEQKKFKYQTYFEFSCWIFEIFLVFNLRTRKYSRKFRIKACIYS